MLVIVTVFPALVVSINVLANVKLLVERVSCPHELTLAIMNKAENNKTLRSFLASEITQEFAAKAVARIGSLQRRAINFYLGLFFAELGG